MPLANNQKLHAKQHFQTKNSKGRQRKQDQGIDFDPNIYVYKGMREGASDLYGVYRLTDDGFNRVGDWEAA